MTTESQDCPCPLCQSPATVFPPFQRDGAEKRHRYDCPEDGVFYIGECALHDRVGSRERTFEEQMQFDQTECESIRRRIKDFHETAEKGSWPIITNSKPPLTTYLVEELRP